jgi:hypothetical protein
MMLDIQKIHDALDKFILSNPTEDYHVHIEKDDRQRPYLGLSGLGESCMRKVWYQWRHALKPSFPPRMHRLFRRGDREEYVFVWMLRGIGFKIFEVDEDGKQFSVDDFDGHLKGNLDGVAKIPKKFWLEGSEPFPVLTEYKTVNDKGFQKYLKDGVKKTNPKYWGQMGGYMGYMKLKGALFFIVNKNDDSLYIEFVPFNKFEFRRLVDKAEDVVQAQEAPPRLSNNASWYECKFCDFHGICHKNQPAQKICRTCVHASPGPDKSWVCGKGKVYGEVCSKWKDITKV